MPEPDTAPVQSPDSLQPGRAETALLHDLTRWREQLARSIARNNLGMRSEPVATAVNRILFSLLFMCLAEDRGLIGAGTLRAMEDSFGTSHALPEILRYTRGLYTEDLPATHDDLEEFSDIVIDDRELLTILATLAAAERPYNFAVMPTDTLSEILLGYLARTVRRSATHQAIIVDTHDTTQSAGTTVPPLPAVRYMVRSSLTAARAVRSSREILPLRVLDPACGAGGILLTAYQNLLDHSSGGIPGFEERREILTDSIYGLDINRHAVAVTRMLLLFRLTETRGPEKVYGDFLRFSEEVFRDLRHTIRCGNGLIGPEIVHDESWMFCPARDRHALRPFSWRQEFPEIFTAGGFDAVISNPPEGVLEQREWIQQYFQRHYEVYHPSIDRSAFFLEKSFALVNQGGSVSCLMSNRWLRGAAGSRLRGLLNARQIEEIVDFSGVSGAKPGRELCLIRVRTSSPSHSCPVTLAGPLFFENPEAFVTTYRFPVDQQQLDEGGWLFRDTRAEEIVCRVSLHSTSLEGFVMGQVHAGIPVPEENPFVIRESLAAEWLRRDPRCKPLLRRLVTGTEIGRYGAGTAGNFLLLIPQGWTASHIKGTKQPWQWLKHHHPLIAKFLQPFAERQKDRAGPDELWWESGCDEFWQEFHKKILVPARFSSPAFLVDAGRGIGDDTTTAIPSAGLYLPGILNSRLMAFVFDQSVRKTDPDRQWFSWDDLKTLPIYTPDFDRPEDRARHDQMEKLVQRRIDLEKSYRAAITDQGRETLQKKIRTADRQIDSLVYGIYGLTADEITVVETSSS
jgi:adenine-specific DNA-methyltransferase